MEIIERAKTWEEQQLEDYLVNEHEGWVICTPTHIILYKRKPRWVGKRSKPTYLKNILPSGAEYSLYHSGKWVQSWINE